MRIVIALIACLIVYLALRILFRHNPAKFTRSLLYVFMGGFILGVILLAATGRLHWLFALLAGLIPLANRLLGLLRFLPFIQMLSRLLGLKKGTGGYSSRKSTGGGSSSVESHFFRMTLDHASGEMQGTVLHGSYAGSNLATLGVEQLRELLLQCEADSDSMSLLVAYLERRFGPDWMHQFSVADESQAHQNGSAGDMSRDEARKILGVPDDADKKQIVSAHRSLMQKFHPDRGGSDYLAAKINRAKELLLEDK